MLVVVSQFVYFIFLAGRARALTNSLVSFSSFTAQSQWFWMPHEDESYVAVKMVVDGGARCTVAAVQGHQVRYFEEFNFLFCLDSN